MANKDVQCPHCNEIFEINLDELSPDDLAPYLSKAAGKENHRHKTADEFADCPECRAWFDKTATKYNLSAKEPAASETEPERSPIGSIFKKGGE